ncbi:MAG: hypothetical protein H0V12_04310 [Chloroflexi bacterium]|nr:hypothetical protein [Chloroflexota bacterium]
MIDRQAAASNNFAVHVRHIHEMIELFEDNALQGVELPVAAAAVAPGGSGGGGGGGGAGGGGGGEQQGTAGRYTGAVSDPAAQHELTFTVADNGIIEGTSTWPQTGEFVLSGQVNADGTFQMTDDAPERLGFRRGVYQGTIAADGSLTGTYFEQTQEQSSWDLAGQRVP